MTKKQEHSPEVLEWLACMGKPRRPEWTLGDTVYLFLIGLLLWFILFNLAGVPL